MGKYFGTDGIRGEANTGSMNPAMVLRVGQALGIVLKSQTDHPKVVVGKDTRVSGYMLEGILAAGLCSVGVDVLFLGPLPTPGVAYLTRGLRASAGVMISASHNPFSDNGIKFFDRDGFKLPDALEERIEALMDDPVTLENQLVTGEKIGRAKRIDDAIGQYAVFLKERFPKSMKLDGLRIVLDCANGAGYRVSPKVFSELGAEVFCINNEPNGFNINFESGALHPERLREEVLRYRANVGFALDGDADRLVVVDECGQVLDGDQVLALCALDLDAQGLLKERKIVVTVMSNMGLEVALAQRGIEVVRTPVGDRYVMEEMRQSGAILGGEQSGHLLFLDSSTTGDGILAALKILEILCRTEKPVSELSAVMQRVPQVTHNMRVSQKKPLSECPKTQALIHSIEQALGSQGRILFRYSGTEKLARVTLEGPSLSKLRHWAHEVERTLLAELGH